MAKTHAKPKIATVWLDGCSGCHMSFLDMDERLVEIAGLVDVVHSPVVDPKDFPHDVVVTLVEGAVSSDHDLHLAQVLRKRSRLVVSLGDCAVTGNVPSMRNPHKDKVLLDRAYVENATTNPGHPTRHVPPLQVRARPLHEVIDVDLFLPGCPPPADAIHYVITEVLEGRTPDPTRLTRFGM
jgi:NAD-reducing hydrogenase small subunit